jgi:anthranilate phosphoribosyltransferase
MFACASLIREIGRGKEGARSLSAEQAQALYAAMLEGQVSDIELGAVLIALRVKGESVQELTGFCQAAQTLLPVVQTPVNSSLPTLVFPSYNGARRRPNLLPLLAGALARLGYPVLVHGHLEDPTGRITTAEVFGHLRWPQTANAGDDVSKALADAYNQRWPLFVATQHLNAGLVSLLDRRRVLGVRNATHTIVKLIQPVRGASLLVTSYTHPEFFHLQREVLAGLGVDALVIRGHEGEAVAHPQKAPRMDAVRGGRTWCVDEGDPTFVDMPERNPDKDAQHTAEQALELLVDMDQHGVSVLPPGLRRQIQAIESMVREGTV